MNIFQKSRKSLEYNKVLLELASLAKINQSKELCLNLLPFSQFSDIERELLYTREAKYLLDFVNDIPIDFVQNFTKLKSKNEYFIEEELVDIAKSLRTFRLVRNFLKENLQVDSILRNLSEGIFTNKELENRIFDIFDDNYLVKPTATKELQGLYSSLKDTENNLKEKVRDLMNSSEFQSHLQENIYTMRDDRIVFQVKASSKSKVSGIVHDVSATNRTFYIEPSSIVPINNKIRELKSKIYAEIIKILTAISNEIRSVIGDLILSEELISKIDLYFAKARYAIKIQAIEPELSKDRIIKIDLMRHPLLIGNVDNIVENDFSIGEEYKSVIITGSNTGGKTVALKTVGLFILMMKSGLFLPCAGACIYPFEKVLADIGDEQNIAQSLSTFSSHMKNIVSILNLADANTFILIDELCSGTDPQEGAVLAEVILKDFIKKGAFSVITTHYGELKSLEFIDSNFKNASVEFDSESLRPTYKLIIGIPGLSNAISISSNLGLSPDLVWDAKQILVTHRDPSVIAVEKLQDTQQKLDMNLKEAEVLNAEAQDLKLEYQKELSQHKKDKKRTIKGIKERFDSQLENAKSEIKEILNELRQEKSEKIARRAYSRLAELERNFKEDLYSFEEKENYQELDWNCIKVSDKVMLKNLNQGVSVLSLPDKNGNLFIQMGMIKTKINKEKLAVLDKDLIKKTFLPNYQKETFSLKKYNISNTLDLRGKRVEEALDELEGYLDEASLANLSPVYIIHGHGTGALKTAVRDFVSDSPYVSKYRIGEEAEGGDGVCVIDIK